MDRKPALNPLKASKSAMLQATRTDTAKFGKAGWKAILSAYYPLLAVLVGFFFVALSIGPYHNGDSTWELDAVSGVMKYGLPYTNGFYLMDQPPLGFYIQAAFATVFGLSLNYGSFLVMLFGLGCVALVYGIGALIYNRTTAFFAALLFAFSPWHLILSRTYLIDVQCLFFSLASLFVGILAIQRNSLKLFSVAGMLFAAAFMTKLYAAFTLIPLSVLFLRYGTKKPLRFLGAVTVFILPLLVAYYFWYQTVSGLGVASIFGHTDFMVNNAPDVVPSYFFVSNFLINYGLGWFFLDAAAFSLLFYLFAKRLFGRFWLFEVCCLIVIVLMIGIDTYLGVGLNLKAPYLNAVKYDYHALPFFSFLAASVVTKSLSLIKSSSIKWKKPFLLIGLAGLCLTGLAVLYNMRYVHLFSTSDFLIFRVQPDVDVGYSLFNSAPIASDSVLMGAQYLGFAIALSGLLWISRHKLCLLLGRMRNRMSV
ncbi:MAG: glycosyltransferase family 39 protein [Candidatus Bathyarchaeota archaeon]|nr:glycosyltransferase family 39 protein [Candidatus Bathyarchaeota archaeon]